MTSKPHSPLTLIIFAAPSFGLAFVVAPVNAFLPNLYAKHTAISLAAIGTVLMVSRIFDAVSDQLIGYLSDRTRGRLGPRKPWLLGGLPIIMLSVAFLFNPPPTAGIFYFASWSFLYYFGYTLIYVPHLAWASELSGSYKERTRIFTFYSFITQVGQFIVFGGPIVLFLIGTIPSSEMSAEYMYVLMWSFLVLFPFTILLAVWKAPTGDNVAKEAVSLRSVFSTLRSNKLLLRYMSIFLIYGFGQGVLAALIIVYFDSYLGISNRFPYVLIAITVVSLVSLYPWMKIVQRFGKHRPWAVSWIGSIITVPFLAFVEPGPQAFLPVLIVFMLYGFWESVSNVVAQAMLADVVDYDILKTGADKAGSFYALQGLLVKVTAAFGGGAAFILLDVFDYSIGAPEGNTAMARLGFLVTFLAIPAITKLLCLFLIWNYPLDERRHGIIRRRIESLHDRAAVRAGVSEA